VFFLYFSVTVFVREASLAGCTVSALFEEKVSFEKLFLRVLSSPLQVRTTPVPVARLIDNNPCIPALREATIMPFAALAFSDQITLYFCFSKMAVVDLSLFPITKPCRVVTGPLGSEGASFARALLRSHTQNHWQPTPYKTKQDTEKVETHFIV
jgi:hypothetical protein